MTDYTLIVPEDVYIHAQKIAEETAQPVEKVMIEHLRTLSTLIPSLPPEEEAELEALKQLSDDALWTIAREQMPRDDQTQMQNLMDKNSSGSISTGEYSQLEGLVERGQKLMLRKSEATKLLTERGYKVTPRDLAPRE